jgi:hypothetical protein
MPRYFFHFASNDEFIPDEDGEVLDGLKAAHLHAMRLVNQTASTLRQDDPNHWTIEVADERQAVLLTVLFSARPPACNLPVGRREPMKLDRVVVRHKGSGADADLFLRPPGGEGHHP